MEKIQKDDQCQHPECNFPHPAMGDYCSTMHKSDEWRATANVGIRNAVSKLSHKF